MSTKQSGTLSSEVPSFTDSGGESLPANVGIRTASNFVIKSTLPDRKVPEVPLHEYLWANRDKWINLEALVCGKSGKSVTFGELKRQSEQFCAVLRSKLGLKPGDVLAINLPNCLEYPPIILGSLEAGVIVSPLDPAYTLNERTYHLKNSGAKAAVTSPEQLSAVQEAARKLDLKEFQIVTTGPIGSVQDPSILSYDSLLNDVSQSTVSGTKGLPDDTVYIPYSSGTTGVPKGVCLTNKNLVSNMIICSTSNHFDETTGTEQSVIPVIRPMFHIYGFMIMGIAVRSGAKLVIFPKLEETTLIRALRDHKASVLYAVPHLVQQMIVSESIGAVEMESLKSVICGAAPLAESDIRRLIQKSGRSLQVRQLYGMTETSPICTDGLTNGRLGSVGRPAVNTQMKIVEAGGSSDEPLGPGVTGEICVRGPQVMKGYLNNKKATDETIDSTGWLHSGDIGHYDSENYFFVTDRLKEMIKVNGFQVAPAEVEAVLRTHPDILDVGVVGAKDSVKGETPVAFVVVKEISSWKEDKVKEFLGLRLMPQKIPTKFVKVQDIPKSQAGKILRRELRAMVDRS